MRMARRTNLLLPEELVREVDHFAGPRGRSRYVAEALRARIRRDRLREAVERTAGVLSTEDYPDWATTATLFSFPRFICLPGFRQ